MKKPDHVDLTSLTLLAQDVPGGLEVWDDKEEEWLQVPVFTDSILLNAGLFMEQWTDGEIKATRHRVVAKPDDRRRHSAVFFCTPNWESRLEAAPTNRALFYASSHSITDSTTVNTGLTDSALVESNFDTGGGNEMLHGVLRDEPEMVGDLIPFG